MSTNIKFVILILIGIFSIANSSQADILFSESFENNNFSSRGWYDGNPTANGIVSGGQVMNHGNVIYRTNQDATKKFHQFIFGP